MTMWPTQSRVGNERSVAENVNQSRSGKEEEVK